MREISFGQYYPAPSPIHRMDARAKLIISIGYIVALLFIPTISSFLAVQEATLKGYIAVVTICYAAFALFIVLLAIFSRIPLTKILKSIKVLLVLIIFMSVISVLFYGGKVTDDSWRVKLWAITIYSESLLNAGAMALRLVFLALGPAVLTLTTTPVELTDAIESLLKPLKIFRFPAHELAMIMSITLRLIPTLIEETDKIINAQKARCADFDSGNLFKRAKALVPILIPLFISSFRRADELADAMESRCYKGSKGRTRMKQLRFSYRDLIGFLVFAALLFLVLCLRYGWFGFAAFLIGLF